MTSVLLVDDQPLLRMALRMVLEAHDDLSVCGEGGDGAVAVELTARLEPDVVLLDIRMPVMDGVEARRPWRRRLFRNPRQPSQPPRRCIR
jgi:chemotaxis response regulator CheB